MSVSDDVVGPADVRKVSLMCAERCDVGFLCRTESGGDRDTESVILSLRYSQTLCDVRVGQTMCGPEHQPMFHFRLIRSSASVFP